jgi:hypothetical protein
VPNEWLREHARGAWTIWGLGEESCFLFEDANDAFNFKVFCT